MTDLLAIGKIRTSVGLKGHMKVLSFSGETDHFLELGSLILGSGNRRKEFLIEEVFVRSNDLVMKLAGIDTPEAVKMYNGWDILVSRDKAAPLEEGEYYTADLIGCTLIWAGKPVGKVLSLVEGGGGELLEVEKTDGTTCFVPFRKEFIGDVDTEKNTIELIVDWILT
jgi:16S rRNA processing protein RimM